MRTGCLSLKYEDCPTSDTGAGRIIIESYVGSIPTLPSSGRVVYWLKKWCE